MAYLSITPATTLNPSSLSIFPKTSIPQSFKPHPPAPIITKPFCSKNTDKNGGLRRNPFFLSCTNSNAPTTFVLGTETEPETVEDFSSDDEYSGGEETEADDDSDGEEVPAPTAGTGGTPRRHRYRKGYPGENEGIAQEMRFVAMKLRNSGKPKRRKRSAVNGAVNGVENEGAVKGVENEGDKEDNDGEEKDGGGDGGTWQPSMDGFLKYLVDSELVFRTVERIVHESTDVSYGYFRKTGLERSDCILKDLEWLREQGNVIPEPSDPGVTYAQYLKELAQNSPPLFLCHFYNIYFAHIAGGQVIAKQVSNKILEGRELEFYKWEGDAEELLKGVRYNLNSLGEHWSRYDKNRCLKEATKAFRFLGQIVRLIIL